MTRKLTQNTRPFFSHVQEGSRHETSSELRVSPKKARLCEKLYLVNYLYASATKQLTMNVLYLFLKRGGEFGGGEAKKNWMMRKPGNEAIKLDVGSV